MEQYLKNPWVIGGGAVALIALWWLFSGTSSSGGGTASYAQANLDLVAQQAQISGQIENAQIAANTQNTATIAGAITNLEQFFYAHDLGAKQVAAGVTTAQIGADTAKALEQDQVNITRLNTRNAFNIANVQAGQAESLANIQASAAENINNAKLAAQNQSQTLGFISSLLTPLGL